MMFIKVKILENPEHIFDETYDSSEPQFYKDGKIAYKLKSVLKSLGLTQKELSERLNISSRTMAKFSKGEPVSLSLLIKICDELGCNLEDLVYISHQTSQLLSQILQEKQMRLHGSLYHEIQVLFTYNSNHIEGSRLNEDETRYIYETHTVNGNHSTDDIIETINHFRCFDFMLDTIMQPLTENLVKQYHLILKSGTSDSTKDWFNVGEYKSKANVVGGKDTCLPEQVQEQISKLLLSYRNIKNPTLEQIAEFHYKFESIHPFQDGNGRVGRMIMFRQCLRSNVLPFIIDDEHKYFYYRGLNEFDNQRGFLTGTFESCQDNFRVLLKRFNAPEN